MKTDTQLQLDVAAELKWEPAVSATHIGVSVQDGVVTISGHVATFLEKWHAENAALRVSGVRLLVMEIEVRLADLAQRSDVDIAGSAELALQWMDAPVRDAGKVVVDKGWLTLSGSLKWQHERQAVGTVMRYISGVKGISNQIAINPSVTADSVQSEIESALIRQAHIDARNVLVKIQGNTVTLSGVVQSWAERQSAIYAAWNMPGVRSVVDHMSLTF
ncbi:MAG: OsmY domain-containing protein [Burkholderiales bacterium PBB4]|nr:MAG: OsmY domain-containing protein [Burkholderiales bacterium PBB4]